MKITVTKEWTQASQVAACRLLEFLLEKDESVAINLATGNSPKLLYAELVKHLNNHESAKSRLHFFHLDEFLKIKESDSYSTELRDGVLKDLGVSDDNFHPWLINEKDPDATCLTLSSHWHSKERKICVLGVGENGHIGFNEPGSALGKTASVMNLTDSTRNALKARFGNSEVPESGVGFGVADILAADRIILLATGSSKAKIVAKMLHGPISPDCPASFLRLHPDCQVFLDEEAAHDYTYEANLFVEEKEAVGTESRVEGNILLLSPHPDDTSISAGGFLFRHSESNKVKTINVYSGHRADIPDSNLDSRIETRKREAEAEAKVLNIAMEFPQLEGYDNDYALLDKDVEYIVEQINSWQPKHIFTPWIKDPHPAHLACTKILFKALEQANISSDTCLWFYETPWGLFRPGEMNTFVALTHDETMAKLKAIGMHASQVHRTPYDYAADALTRLRSVVSLEQEFAGYGKAHGVELGKNVECFYRIRIS